MHKKRKLFYCLETFYPYEGARLNEAEVYDLIEESENGSFFESVHKFDTIYCIEPDEIENYMIPILPSGRQNIGQLFECIDSFYKDKHHFKKGEVYTLFKDDNIDLYVNDLDNNLFVIPKMECFDRFKIKTKG